MGLRAGGRAFEYLGVFSLFFFFLTFFSTKIRHVLSPTLIDLNGVSRCD